MIPVESYCERESFLHDRDARVKLIACVGLVIALSAASAPARLAALALLLGALLLLGKLSLWSIARGTLTVLPFLLAPVLSAPFMKPVAGMSGSPWENVAIIGVRSWLAAAALLALMGSTRYADLLDGMARLGMPRILITLGAFLYRYLFVLLEEAGRMRLARDLRGGMGGFASGARLAGTMAAALFLRTYDRAERIHQAMLARGFDGLSRRLPPRTLNLGDWAFLILFLAGFGAVLWLV